MFRGVRPRPNGKRQVHVYSLTEANNHDQASKARRSNRSRFPSAYIRPVTEQVVLHWRGDLRPSRPYHRSMICASVVKGPPTVVTFERSRTIDQPIESVFE
jgi:hypothetical protein